MTRRFLEPRFFHSPEQASWSIFRRRIRNEWYEAARLRFGNLLLIKTTAYRPPGRWLKSVYGRLPVVVEAVCSRVHSHAQLAEFFARTHHVCCGQQGNSAKICLNPRVGWFHVFLFSSFLFCCMVRKTLYELFCQYVVVPRERKKEMR